VAATPSFVATAAKAAEQAGFCTVWTGDHIVLFERYPESNYPYKNEYGGDVPIPDPTVPILDPIIAMTWAAAVTSTIEVGSGIVILPQRHPIALAKQVATLDSLSGGRVVLGAGVGWCKEEYDALGADWENRGKRMDEYVLALRSLWREAASTFRGETMHFDRAYLYPKPVRGDVPIVFGGESDASLRRVARYGDGWLALKLPCTEVAVRVKRLRDMTLALGRDAGQLRIIVGIFSATTIDDLKRYRDAGVTEFYLVTANELPSDEAGLKSGIMNFGASFVEAATRL
jgi:probable F420-dependent oxidoreductase